MGKLFIVGFLVSAVLMSVFTSGLRVQTIEAESGAVVRDHWPTTGWRYSSAVEQGMDPTKLEEMMEYIQDENLRVDSVVIVRNGYVVWEKYPRPNVYQQNVTHNLYSCTKSVTSMLVGIALEEGYIDNVQHRLVDFFPNRNIANMDSRKQAITLENVLTMSSGLQWDEWTYGYGDPRDSITQMIHSANWVQYVLDRPMAHEPGTVWTYNGGGSHLLSAIINETTGTNLRDYAREHLLNPLGISDWHWMTDYQGLTFGFSYLQLRPLDMAKLGFLYLNKGLWDGQQVVPTEWVDASTEARYSVFSDTDYGYQWWMHPSTRLYYAWGMAGQRIAVVPDYDMVIVFTGSVTDYDPGDYLISNYILPAATEPPIVVPNDFPTIQEAINNAVDGDTVFVKAGTYYEHVIVNKTVSLMGEDCSTTVIDGNGTGCVMHMLRDNVSVTGFTVQRGQFGMYVQNASYAEIFNNRIVHNYGSDWDAGIRLESAGHAVIRENEIFDNWRGVLVYASSPYVSVCGNNVTSNDYGIRIARGGSSYVNVSDNYVADNRGYGIDVTGFGGEGQSDYATIARNVIVNNTYEAVGLGEGSNYNIVVRNDMIGNGHAGVTLERYSNFNTVVQNNIIENVYGICFDLYMINSTQNTIFNNNLIDNAQQVRIVPGSVNSWNGSYALGGNYWSDHNPPDVDEDKIGDLPYTIDENNADNYPLIYPFECYEPGYVCSPDLNHDGIVNIMDVTMVAVAFTGKPGDSNWRAFADTDLNGIINIVDVTTVAVEYGETV